MELLLILSRQKVYSTCTECAVLLLSCTVFAVSAHIVLFPEDSSTKLGHTLFLPCLAVLTGPNHDAGAVQISWSHNGLPVTSNPSLSHVIHTVSLSQDNMTVIKSVLELCVKAVDVGGEYTCTALAEEAILDAQTFHLRAQPFEGKCHRYLPLPTCPPYPAKSVTNHCLATSCISPVMSTHSWVMVIS